MTPARKAALRKAQLASARKRRGKGRGKLATANRRLARQQIRHRRTLAVAAGGIAVGAVAGYAIHHHVKESALQKKHGGDYIPKRATYHHYTTNNAARRIVHTRTFKPTGAHAGHGHHEGVWLTRVKGGGHDKLTRDVFGKARVSVRLSRKEVLGSRTHSIPGGLDKSNKNISHVQVHKSALNGKRIRHNLPKTRAGTRRRANAYRRIYATDTRRYKTHLRGRNYHISRHMGVHPGVHVAARTLRKLR